LVALYVVRFLGFLIARKASYYSAIATKSWRAFVTVFLSVLGLGVIGGFLGGLLISGTRKALGFPEVPILGSVLAGLIAVCIAWPLANRAALKAALAQFTETIRLDPADPVGYDRRGQVYRLGGWYAQAVADFEEAIRLAPTRPEPHISRVNACGHLGQLDRVIAEATEAIRLDPNDALAYCVRATAHNWLGRLDRSIPDATEAIRLAPDLYLGYDARGFACLRRGNGGPSDYTGILKRAVTPEQQADYQQAIADFTEAIRLNPAAWDCYLGRVQVRRALGEHGEATADEAAVPAGVRELLGRL
jgi:tetratricopeptide (TPR) repeat protein